MEAVQLMTGHGGWPLNVFLTPDQVPFYGGTYFPPEPRHGMAAWPGVLEAVAEAWTQQREEIVEQGSRMAERLGRSAALRAPEGVVLGTEPLDDGVRNLRAAFDPTNGGFGGAPKFPPSSSLLLLWAQCGAWRLVGEQGGGHGRRDAARDGRGRDV